MSQRLTPWLRPALGAVVGGAVFFGINQVMSRAGGTCLILCNPMVAIPYGAILGIFVAGGAKKVVETDRQRDDVTISPP